jgi:shikimate dehydrogenase
MAKRTRLGVAGWPVAHSRSPAMQNAALAAAGLTGWRYQLLPIPPEMFAETVLALPGAGFRGINVTIPHKGAALALATAPSARAQAIGAANTLVFGDDGTVHADNTDAPAMIEALRARLGSLPGASALVLGAGGTARAAVWSLLDAGIDRVSVWNRNPQRARELCAELGGAPVEKPTTADILVHCTPSGLNLENDVPPFNELPITADELPEYRTVVDFVYRDGGTPLSSAARSRGLAVIDGLELLVGQGALSFEQFTGRLADTTVMTEATGAGRVG